MVASFLFIVKSIVKIVKKTHIYGLFALFIV